MLWAATNERFAEVAPDPHPMVKLHTNAIANGRTNFKSELFFIGPHPRNRCFNRLNTLLRTIDEQSKISIPIKICRTRLVEFVKTLGDCPLAVLAVKNNTLNLA